jgi:trans-aconitate methyltransferase
VFSLFFVSHEKQTNKQQQTTTNNNKQQQTNNNKQQQQQQQWNVDQYQTQHNFVWKYGMQSLYELAKPKPGEYILDLGCGTGELTNEFYQKTRMMKNNNNDRNTQNNRGTTSTTGSTTATCDSPLTMQNTIVVGIDSDLNMIRKATEQYPHIEFRQGDMRTFATSVLVAVPDNDTDFQESILPKEYDLIFSNAAMHWIPSNDIDLVMSDIVSSLKNGGRLVVEFGGYGNVQTIIEGCEYATNQLLKQQQPQIDLTFPYYKQPWYFPKIAELASVVEEKDKNDNMEITLMELYDRPTPLIGDDGIEQWIRQFGSQKLIPFGVLEDDFLTSQFFHYVNEYVRPFLYNPMEQYWFADYRRIRMVATKKQKRTKEK